MTTTYITPPVITDPDDLAQAAIEFIQNAYPGWVPAAPNLDVWIIEAVAQFAAEIGTTAAAVITSIYRYLGTLVGVLPIDATPASGQTTWTVVDNLGYTIPAGTLVQIPGGNGAMIPFSVAADAVVPAGTTTTAAGAVELVAVNAGADGSGLGTAGETLQLLNPLSYVTAVTLAATTTGGVDAEADDTYLNRLTAQLQLLTPRPIIASDFAALAENQAGVARALAIDLYQPAVNEIQTVTINATGGTYTLTFGGHTTTAIAYNANAAAVKAALQALTGVGAGNIDVTGGPGGAAPLTVTFTGTLGGANQAQITSDATLLTGGTHTATVATVTNGAPADPAAPRTVTVAVVDANGNADPGGTKSALLTQLESLREVNFIVNVIDPTYTEVDASFTVQVQEGFDPATVVAAAQAAAAVFLSPATWGLPTSGDIRSWIDTDTVRILDAAAAIKNVQGVQSVVTVELALHGGALAAADVTLAGPASLPLVGTITGAHT